MEYKMNKRGIYAVILALALFPNDAYGQEENAITLLGLQIDLATKIGLSGMGAGFGYERALFDYMTWSAAIAFYPEEGKETQLMEGDDPYYEWFNYKNFKMELRTIFRLYPFGEALNGFFIGVGGGYTFLSLETISTKLSNLVSPQLEIGGKIIVREYFFIQPWVGFKTFFGTLDLPEYPAWYKQRYLFFGDNIIYCINAGVAFGFTL
ncbi:MAG: hypothetical protein LBH18_05605 [Spirochaetaceae bacterium]|jgi:hypothetical protein|nr:hypothetical protein [Spirochaetaceae bacterium]